MKYLTLILCLLGILAVSCNELDQFTQFDLPYSFAVTLPGAIPIDDPLSVSTPPIATELEARLQDFNTSSDLIEEVTLKEMNLMVTAPVGQGMDFLASMEVYIDASGQEEAKIAFEDSISNTIGTLLSLQTLPVDVKPYLLADSMTFRLVLRTDTLLIDPVDLEIETIFRVDAKILGI